MTEPAGDVVEQVTQPTAEVVEQASQVTERASEAIEPVAEQQTALAGVPTTDAESSSTNVLGAVSSIVDTLTADDTEPTPIVETAREAVSDLTSVPQSVVQPDVSPAVTERSSEGVLVADSVGTLLDDVVGVSTTVRDLTGAVAAVAEPVVDLAEPVSETLLVPVVAPLIDPVVSDVVAPVLGSAVTLVTDTVEPVTAAVSPLVSSVTAPVGGSLIGLVSDLSSTRTVQFVDVTFLSPPAIQFYDVEVRSPAPEPVSVDVTSPPQASSVAEAPERWHLEHEVGSAGAAQASTVAAVGDVTSTVSGSEHEPVPVGTPVSAPSSAGNAAGQSFGAGHADVTGGLRLPSDFLSTLAVSAPPGTALDVILDVIVAPD
ncbi:hypothetical protein [Ruania alba]|uniref:hypothetical protein n=1 Tax=Ruania alba TaxID=648782 RepID=UPI001114205C|nr:hypothetical protein [Ruania alba]